MKIHPVHYLVLLVITCLFVSSQQGKFITTWVKTRDSMYPYSKILVIVIVNDSGNHVRMQLEDRLTDGLNSYGYQAVSALRRYGPLGLSKMGEENMFLHLNDEKIDAVMAVTLVDIGRDSALNANTIPDYSAVYFFNRLWQYKDMAGVFSVADTGPTSFSWEVLFFELPTLAPRCNLKTIPFSPKALLQITDGIPENIVQQLAREKIIKRQ